MDVRGSNNRIAGRDYYELRIECRPPPLDEVLLLQLYRELTVISRKRLLGLAMQLNSFGTQE